GPQHLQRDAPEKPADRPGDERDPGGAGPGDPEEAQRAGHRGPARVRGRVEAHPRADLDHLPPQEVDVDDYKGLLSKVDAWYRSVKERHPDRVPCVKGCRDCCIGLFDVTLADRDLLREGLAAADPEVRKD